jgi:predicted NUDIX family NTP pyrophosphohydrolase
MPKLSAGLLLYRISDGTVEVLIGHPGGPFWAKKDDGAWSIPKGEYTDGEDPWAAARREFEEELGKSPPDGPRIDLPPLKQPSGKIITAFLVRGDLDLEGTASNTFELEWPKGSGKVREYPEIDRVDWFSVTAARSKLLKGQRSLLDHLVAAVEDAGSGASQQH